MRIWNMRIFPSLKKRISQGPAVFNYQLYCSTNIFAPHYEYTVLLIKTIE